MMIDGARRRPRVPLTGLRDEERGSTGNRDRSLPLGYGFPGGFPGFPIDLTTASQADPSPAPRTLAARWRGGVKRPADSAASHTRPARPGPAPASRRSPA